MATIDYYRDIWPLVLNWTYSHGFHEMRFDERLWAWVCMTYVEAIQYRGTTRVLFM